MERSIFVIFGAALAVISLLSCNNPFSTRTPQTPPDGGAVILPPTSPEKVLNNLVESLRTKSIQDYMDVFSDPFTFSPDPLDSLKYEQEFRSTWNREKESAFVMNYFIPDSTFTISLTTYRTPEYNSGDKMYKYWYKLTFGRENKEDIYGEAWLYFIENSGKWSIYLWVDHRGYPKDPNKDSWGAVRARYS
ncbi:MAG: hypothetical protein Q8O92_16170 [Candidatus Latescibacter sp.]|nr:hypothetical protein [Candidatus Latescibacter sp.]